MQSQAADAQDGPTRKRIRVQQKSAYKQAFTIMEYIWGNADTNQSHLSRTDFGPRHVGEAATHVAARNKKRKVKHEVCLYPNTRFLRATLYPIRTSELLTT